ncbi:hypothetical protein AKO1_013049 [Acrasis kona]|uniref:Uncharacterized protein n=1 Tax=Acrasis kona TaxID=1008807 RepID=A0AAW2YZ54_9EUKA
MSIILIKEIKEVVNVWLRKKPEDPSYIIIRTNSLSDKNATSEMLIHFDNYYRDIFLSHLKDCYEAFVGPFVIGNEPRYLELVENDFLSPPLITGTDAPVTMGLTDWSFINKEKDIIKIPNSTRSGQNAYESILHFIERKVKKIYFACNVGFPEYKDHIVGNLERGVMIITDRGLFFIDSKYSFHRVHLNHVLEVVMDKSNIDHPNMLLYMSNTNPTSMHIKFKILRKEEREVFMSIMLSRFNIQCTYEDKSVMDLMIKRGSDAIKRFCTIKNFTKKLGDALRGLLPCTNASDLIDGFLNVYYSYRVVWHYLNKRNCETRLDKSAYIESSGENKPDRILTLMFLFALDRCSEYTIQLMYVTNIFNRLGDIEAEHSRLELAKDGYYRIIKECNHFKSKHFGILAVRKNSYNKQTGLEDTLPNLNYQINVLKNKHIVIERLFERHNINLISVLQTSEDKANKLLRLHKFLIGKEDEMLKGEVRMNDVLAYYDFDPKMTYGKLIYHNLLQKFYSEKKSDDKSKIDSSIEKAQKKYCLKDKPSNVDVPQNRGNINHADGQVTSKRSLRKISTRNIKHRLSVVAPINPQDASKYDLITDAINIDTSHGTALTFVSESVRTPREFRVNSPRDENQHDTIDEVIDGTMTLRANELLKLNNIASNQDKKYMQQKQEDDFEKMLDNMLSELSKNVDMEPLIPYTSLEPIRSKNQEKKRDIMNALGLFDSLQLILFEIQKLSKSSSVSTNQLELVVDKSVKTDEMVSVIEEIVMNENYASLVDMLLDTKYPLAENCIKEFQITIGYRSNMTPRDCNKKLIEFLLENKYFSDMIRLLIDRGYLNKNYSNEEIENLHLFLNDVENFKFNLSEATKISWKGHPLHDLIMSSNNDSEHLILALKKTNFNDH